MANKKFCKEVYETARSLYDLGWVDAETLRKFDASRLPALKPYGAADIKRLRLKARSSQSVFAADLNTSVLTVQKWEIGDKKPSGPTLKLVNIVELKGLKALAEVKIGKRQDPFVCVLTATASGFSADRRPPSALWSAR